MKFLSTPARNKNNGFTLIELLVALTLLAVMATLAYSGLNAVMVSSSKIKKHQQLIADIQRMVLFLEKDIRQLSPRSRFTEHETYVPALEVIENNSVLMAFSRGGVYSPNIVPRSSLQRVAYKLTEEHELVRVTWPYVDFLIETKPVELVLVDNIVDVRIKLLNKQNQWQSSWGQKGGLVELPAAIEFEVEHKTLGIIRRLISIY